MFLSGRNVFWLYIRTCVILIRCHFFWRDLSQIVNGPPSKMGPGVQFYSIKWSPPPLYDKEASSIVGYKALILHDRDIFRVTNIMNMIILYHYLIMVYQRIYIGGRGDLPLLNMPWGSIFHCSKLTPGTYFTASIFNLTLYMLSLFCYM